MRHAVPDVKSDFFVRDTANPDSMTQVLSHARKNHACGRATYAWGECSVYSSVVVIIDDCFEHPFAQGALCSRSSSRHALGRPWRMAHVQDVPRCISYFRPDGLIVASSSALRGRSPGTVNAFCFSIQSSD